MVVWMSVVQDVTFGLFLSVSVCHIDSVYVCVCVWLKEQPVECAGDAAQISG